jgi:hypothetical protein
MKRRRRLWLWLWRGPYRSFWAVVACATFAWLQAATLYAEYTVGFGGEGWAAMGWFALRFMAAAMINVIASLIWPISWVYELGPVVGIGGALVAFAVWVFGRYRIQLPADPRVR